MIKGQNPDSIPLDFDKINKTLVELGTEFCDDETCLMLNEILLSTDLINYYERIFKTKGIKSIRIFDLTNTLKSGFCRWSPEVTFLSLRVKNELSPDINTGRYIDFVVLDYLTLEDSTVKLKIFYFDIIKNSLISGNVTVEKINGVYKVIDYKFSRFS